MPINDFRKIAQSCRRLGYEGMGFSAFGEVFTHKDAVEIISSAKEMGFKNIETHTNGIALYKYDMEKLLTSGLDILKISFPGFGKEPFVRIFGVDRYEEFKMSVKILLETHRKINSKMRISFLPRTYLTMKQIQESEFYTQFIAEHLNDRINICDPTKVFETWGGVIKKSDMVNSMKLDINPLKSLYPLKKPFLCSNLLSYGVTVNGDVRVCNCKYDFSIETPEDPFLVGNIWDYESMEDLMKKNTDKANKLLSDFRNGKMPGLCKACAVYTPFDPNHKPFGKSS